MPVRRHPSMAAREAAHAFGHWLVSEYKGVGVAKNILSLEALRPKWAAEINRKFASTSRSMRIRTKNSHNCI